MIEIIRGSTEKPIVSDQLIKVLSGMNDIDGVLYIGYPIIGTPEGPFRVDALLLSRQHGVTIFDLVEGKDIGNYGDRLDQAFLKMQSRLLQHGGLAKNRTLKVAISTITFAPSLPLILRPSPSKDDDETHLALKDDELSGLVFDTGAIVDENTYRLLLSVIQAVTTIRARARKRNVKKENSRGAIAQRLEESIANLDAHQSSAVIRTINGVQQIRGLAGSGKTIVLALKVAYLHAQNPDWKIAVTFNTRSLKGILKRLITLFVLEQTGQEPDFQNVEIINAWGAAGDPDREGVYFKFCQANDIPYLDFRTARYYAGSNGSDDAFDFACRTALDKAKAPNQIYDAILVDEAQDFKPSFLRLCYAFLKPPKRFVYAFDELQSLNPRDSMPLPNDIFGLDAYGKPLVSLAEEQDIVLEKCYRNSRPVLVTAHALGFGIYRDKGLVQMFDEPGLWEDIGYRLREGDFIDGQRVRLNRIPDTSPLFLENHSPIEDLIQFNRFESEEDQAKYLVDQILVNLNEDELTPEDIIVINADPIKARDQVAIARSLLYNHEINSELAGVSTRPDVFYSEGSITFSGIYRAKGNEAPMVYVINAQHCAAGPQLDVRRNILFTAITRSKAWVRVFGVGNGMDNLIKEYQKIEEEGFELDFIYPSEAKRKQMRVYYKTDKERVARRKKMLKTRMKDLVDLLESGEIESSEIPADYKKALQKLIKN